MKKNVNEDQIALVTIPPVIVLKNVEIEHILTWKEGGKFLDGLHSSYRSSGIKKFLRIVTDQLMMRLVTPLNRLRVHYSNLQHMTRVDDKW